MATTPANAQAPKASWPKQLWIELRETFDADYFHEGREQVLKLPNKVTFKHALPFAMMHLGCLAVLWVGVSPVAVGVAIFLYWFRMFAITAFFHRYFSHRSFKTNRFWQFVFAAWTGLAIQKGALWWASHHRHHHLRSDQPDDTHSPAQQGLAYSHIGWILSRNNLATDYKRIKDLSKFPELVFLNRYDWLMPMLYGLSLMGLGYALEIWAPSLGTSAAQMFVWGFFVSTVVLYHGTFCINSLAHLLGKPRYQTNEDSKNHWLLAFITMGEGWHNNHHAYPSSARQGLYWWEIDASYWILRGMQALGMVWDLKPFPPQAYQQAKEAKRMKAPAPIAVELQVKPNVIPVARENASSSVESEPQSSLA